MVVGNMGSKEIFDYTVLAMRLTSARLEPLIRILAPILLFLKARCETEKYYPGKIYFPLSAKVALKGRSAPLNAYELVGWKDTIDELLEVIEIYSEGLDLF